MDSELITDIHTIGIIGAGTMGSGIALTALYADFQVILQDIHPSALDKSKEYLEKYLTRKNLGGRMTNLKLTTQLEDLASVDFVIEAALEDINLKQNLFSLIEKICRGNVVLATNTSTLSVTSIASEVIHPEKVVGMHFFNPAPVMPLVEVVKTVKTAPVVIDIVYSVVSRLDKVAVEVNDTPGFIVNRVARPFYGEALRLLGEGVASHEIIDQIVQFGAGFRMGPFRLMDLIGLDINGKAMASMFEQSFLEPRYRPHWIQMQMVASKSLGYKTLKGFYDYSEEASKQEMPTPPEIGDNAGTIIISNGAFSPGLRELCQKSGYVLVDHPIPEMAPLIGIVMNGKREGLREAVVSLENTLPPDAPLLCQCADIPLGEIATWLEYPETLVGFDGLFFCNGSIATLVELPFLADHVRQATNQFVESLGRIPKWISDSPGLILPRIICMLINEAAFAVLDRVSSPDKIDLAMRLGANYPEGPLAWGESLGFSKVLAVIENLYDEFREDRYRPCILLRHWERLERLAAFHHL